MGSARTGGIKYVLKHWFKHRRWLKLILLVLLVWISRQGGVVSNGAAIGAALAIGPLAIIVGLEHNKYMRQVRRAVMSDVGKLLYIIFATAMAGTMTGDSVTGLVAAAYALTAKIFVLDLFDWFYGDDPLTWSEVKAFCYRTVASALKGIGKLLSPKSS